MRFLLIVSFLLSVLMLQAQDSVMNLAKNTVIKKSSITINNQVISYTSTTGFLKLIDEKGKHIANIFFVAYTKNGVTDIAKRPISYAFNGGPGSSSVWLHLGTMGPKRIKMTPEGDAMAPPYELIDNEYSWLDLTDMVFIDPVGAGFSYPEKNEKDASFYGYENDIKSVGEFIRLYTNTFQRWASPKYLVGESYGTTRASGLSTYLIDEHAMFVNGIVLLSAALDFQTLRENQGNDLPYICNLPAYTATALYHKKLSSVQQSDEQKTIKEAENFALNTYSVALLKGDLLSRNEKSKIASELSKFTGLDTTYILKSNLRVPTSRFRKQLLADKEISCGRFDSRLTIAQSNLTSDYEVNDPSYVRIMGAFGTSFNAYVRDDLGFTINYPFHVIGDVNPWKFADGKYLSVSDQLKDAIIQNPYLKIWVGNGVYDLATSYFGTEYSINHMNLTTEQRKQITLTYYKAGHMMYLHNPSLVQLKKDAQAFYVK